MGRIVAISGGDLSSTRPLNLHAIKLSGKTNPNVLFVGTASRDADGYIASIEKEYKNLGCQVKSLCLVTKSYRNEDIDILLSWADIVYVGGGDAVSMMLVWKQHGLDEKLKEIYRKDAAVLTGLSAGAICWFNCGHSDSDSFHGNEDCHYSWADGMLNFFDYAFCPHYNEAGRESFDSMLKEKKLTGLAMENDTAFVENNGNQYFIKSNSSAKAFEIRYKNGLMEKKPIEFLV
ncbi:Type 1 glutamine amidotransferase-like domain-containing protein [Pseudoflavonifractor sp. CLA-AP-H29]|uniref:Type 1 glutamine amidotransferase-like domain-containing protein n=1 Tax=Pseudoflavonifractor intestinihominis TaxID=3133171 RepID=A0ABV1E754_9FIRM